MKLQAEDSGKPEVVTFLRSLRPILSNYEIFAERFVKLTENTAGTSMLWGLSLVIKVRHLLNICLMNYG